MREIVSLHVGGAGNKIGARFFQTLCAEHRVGPHGALLDHDRFPSTPTGVSAIVANSAGAGEAVEGAAAAGAAYGSSIRDAPVTPFSGALGAAAASRVRRRALVRLEPLTLRLKF